MSSQNIVCIYLFLHLHLANRRSIRHRRQAVASSYGSNLPSGYNYQPNTNYYNPNQNNNQPTNNFYSNSLGSSNVPTGLNNQQQQPQLQPQQPQQPQPNAYNPSGQPWSNPVQQGTNLYSPTGTNTNLNPTGQGSINPMPSASASGSGSGSFYPSSNGQMPYSMNNNNNNQMLTNRDLYSQPSLPNTNTNNNNNNNNNPLQNGYGNNNPWANTNPNTNVYNSNQGSSNYNSPNLYPTYNNDVTRMVLSLGLLFICLIITI